MSNEKDTCSLHKDLVDKTEKILIVLEEIKAVIIGDIKEPDKIGLVTRVSFIEKKVDVVENAKKSLFSFVLKIVAGALVGGLSIKTVIEMLVG